jgi:hypothetical protein
MEGLTIITNNVPRDVIDAWELTADERDEFDYLDWTAIENGEDSASFIRYKGELYDLGEFERWDNPASPTQGTTWDGMRSDTFFSGVLVRYADESCETVVIGRYYS